MFSPLSRIRIGPYTEGIHVALSKECFVINVAEPSENTYADVFIPLVVSRTAAEPIRIPTIRLRLVAQAIAWGLRDSGKDVFVHCTAGLERSPLAVAWYLCTYYGYHIDAAYDLIKSKRFCYDRREWIEFVSYEQREEIDGKARII